MSEEEQVIYIGQKPVTSYVLAALAQLNESNVQRVVLKARGRAISRAVDVAEVIRRRLMKGQVEIDDIRISTESIESEGGRESNVSAIEITIKKV